MWSTGWRSTNVLYGLDPATGAVRVQQRMGAFDHFATPSAGGGRLFVAAGASVNALTISAFPPATTTALNASANPVTAGRAISLIATVSPAPDAGTVAFSSGGAALPGCATVAVAPATGQAVCHPSLGTGTRAGTGRLHRRRVLRPVHLTSAVCARNAGRAVAFSRPPRPSPGHRARRAHPAVHPVCGRAAPRFDRPPRPRPRGPPPVPHGSRARRTLHGHPACPPHLLHGKRAGNRRRLALRGLRPGRYALALSAAGAGGRRSRTVRLRFQVIPTRR